MKLVITQNTVGKPGIKQRGEYDAMELLGRTKGSVLEINEYKTEDNYVIVKTNQELAGRYTHYFYEPHVKIQGTEPNNRPTEAEKKEVALALTKEKQGSREKDRGAKVMIVGLGYRYLNEPIDGCKNFFWYEATRNGERLPRYKYQSLNIVDVAKKLQHARDNYLNGSSIIITSWFRPTEVNRAVGGASMSTHISGSGIDFYILEMDEFQVYRRLDPNWSHGLAVSARGRFNHVDTGRLADDTLVSARRRWDYP